MSTSKFKSGIVKKKIDGRIKKLLESGIKKNHRSFLILIGKRGKSQIVNLHWLLTRCYSGTTPSILWCYRDELGFSPNHVKQTKKIKKDIRRGLRTANLLDPFESFILSNKIRYTKFKDSSKILGQTFKCLIIQNFESITPNLLARTIETVSGGGIIIFLLETIVSLKQLYTMTMDVHKRFRTPSHSIIIPRFNERFTLSLADCSNCLITDDELNVLPINDTAINIINDNKPDISNPVPLSTINEKKDDLNELKMKLRDTKPIGDIISLCLTSDQAKCVLIFLEAIAEKTLSSTVILTAARGRGKSAALGLGIAGAIALQYANIFVTSPSPENLQTLFEITLKGFDVLGYKEHIDYEIIQSTNPLFNRAIVRINIFKQHRQTIQYIQPSDYHKLSSTELLVIDEAAAIPLPTVKKLMGPYLVFLSSTVNGYEGTGRSLSLKLLNNLRKQSLKSHHKSKQKQKQNCRRLREITLNEPIRYSYNDPIELWLNDLLCLNCCSDYNVNSKYDNLSENLQLTYHPDPQQCELYYVNRDSLFSYNKISEYFLQNMMSLYVSSHYKNQPNDLQLMSDAPAHQLFVLLPPQNSNSDKYKNINKLIPDILCVIQINFEGNLTKKIIKSGLIKGKRLSGDLIPWIISQQFQDNDFGKLSGARIVRIATHPHIQSMGYGSKAIQLLIKYFEGKLININDDDDVDNDGPPSKKRKLNNNNSDISMPSIRDNLPALLTNITERKPELLHWLGVSYGLTLKLFKFWKINDFRAVYVRQNPNNVTGEYSCIMIKSLKNNDILNNNNDSDSQWIDSFTHDFVRRFSVLLSYSFKKLDIITALSVLNPSQSLLENNKIKHMHLNNDKNNIISYSSLMNIFSKWDLKRLETYQKNLIDYNLILDLIPSFVELFFNNKLNVQLNYSQCAIICGIGFQKKDVKQISIELNIIKQQTISMLNKSIRKIYASIDCIIQKYVKDNQIKPQYATTTTSSNINTNTMFDPMVKLRKELKGIGYNKKKELQRINIKKNNNNNNNIEIPTTISIAKEPKLVTMPENEISSSIDPKFYQNKDKAHGINPDSKFHWNKNKNKKNNKKKNKKNESKILEKYKKDRNKNKTKRKRTREQYFG